MKSQIEELVEHLKGHLKNRLAFFAGFTVLSSLFGIFRLGKIDVALAWMINRTLQMY